MFNLTMHGMRDKWWIVFCVVMLCYRSEWLRVHVGYRHTLAISNKMETCILDSPKPAFYTKPSSQQKVKLSAVNGHNMQRDFLVIKVDKHFNANTREYVLSSAWIQHSGVITTKHQHTTDSL